jgi:hypothetical protein
LKRLSFIFGISEVAESKLGMSVEKPNSESEDSYADMNGVNPMQEYEAFVRALPLCVPTTIGFHAEDGESKCCYCSCSTGMKKWKEFCFLDQQEENFCKIWGSKEPCEFLQHAADVSIPSLISETSKTHYILHHYLKTVFQNYYGPGTTQQHWAFKNIGNGKGQRQKKRKRAKAEEAKPG